MKFNVIYGLYILGLTIAVLGRFNFFVISLDTTAIISIIIVCTGIICSYIKAEVKNNDSYNRTN